jgi:lysophospholipase L1-like esterase
MARLQLVVLTFLFFSAPAVAQQRVRVNAPPTTPSAARVRVTGASVGLPTPMLEWTFSEGAGQVAFNQQGTKVALKNFLGNGNFLGSMPTDAAFGSATNVDASADDQNGRHIATLVTNGNDIGWSTINLPAGTYTLSAYVRTDSGTTQGVVLWMRQTEGAGYLLSASQPVTASWTRISFTVTTALGIGPVVMFRPDAATNYLIANVQLEAAGAPTAFVAEQHDAILGGNATIDAAEPGWSAAGVTFTAAGQYLQATTAVPKSLSVMTLYAAVLANSTAALIRPVLDTPDAQLSFNTYNRIDPTIPHTAECTFGTTTVRASLVTPTDGAWHLYTCQYDGTNASLWFDDALAGRVAAPGLSAITLSRLFFGGYSHGSPTFGFDGTIGAIRIFDTVHTALQRAGQVANLRALMTARSVTLPTLTTWVVFDGDSITNTPNEDPYPHLALASLSPVRHGRNLAVSGSAIADLQGRAAGTDGSLVGTTDATQLPGANNILVIMIGHNDLGSGVTPAQHVAALKTYCLARRAAGWKVVVATITPTTLTGGNTARNAANVLIRADASFYDALADTGNTATTIGADAAAANATYFYDGIHPTQAGQALLAPIVAAAIATLLP